MEKPAERVLTLKVLDSPEARALYEAALKQWDKKLQKWTDSLKAMRQVPGADYHIRIH